MFAIHAFRAACDSAPRQPNRTGAVYGGAEIGERGR